MKDCDNKSELESPSRRDMLKKAGKYAVATPPTVSFMLSTALAGQHVAKSGGANTWWDTKQSKPTRNNGFFNGSSSDLPKRQRQSRD